MRALACLQSLLDLLNLVLNTYAGSHNLLRMTDVCKNCNKGSGDLCQICAVLEPLKCKIRICKCYWLKNILLRRNYCTYLTPRCLQQVELFNQFHTFLLLSLIPCLSLNHRDSGLHSVPVWVNFNVEYSQTNLL